MGGEHCNSTHNTQPNRQKLKEKKYGTLHTNTKKKAKKYQNLHTKLKLSWEGT